MDIKKGIEEKKMTSSRSYYNYLLISIVCLIMTFVVQFSAESLGAISIMIWIFLFLVSMTYLVCFLIFSQERKRQDGKEISAFRVIFFAWLGVIAGLCIGGFLGRIGQLHRYFTLSFDLALIMGICGFSFGFYAKKRVSDLSEKGLGFSGIMQKVIWAMVISSGIFITVASLIFAGLLEGLKM